MFSFDQNYYYSGTLITKNQISFVRSLQKKKFREEERCFVSEGPKMVTDMIESVIKIRNIFSISNFQLSLFNHHLEIIRISPREMARISGLKEPSEVLAVCEVPEFPMSSIDPLTNPVLVLDNISDPGNLGTIIRVADWFGISDIVCSRETVDLYNPKVVQATMGSIARVRLHYLDLPGFLANWKEKVEIFGAFLSGENIYEAALPGAGILLIGNESHGISPEVGEFVSRKLVVPRVPHKNKLSGEAESLNAAVATAIICSEFRRRTS